MKVTHCPPTNENMNKMMYGGVIASKGKKSWYMLPKKTNVGTSYAMYYMDINFKQISQVHGIKYCIIFLIE